MKRIPLVAAVMFVFAAASAVATPPQVHEAHTDQDHAAHAAAGSVAIPATRWATDAPLREGMRRVHAALDELRHYEMGHMPPNMALERAVTIEDAITFMFTHCKLAPDPDKALHSILVPLLSAAQRLKNNPKDVAAVAAMRSAVENYPRYFDDAQWSVEAKPSHAH